MGKSNWFTSLAGLSLDGKYVLDKYIGHGKIGFVYQGHHQDMPDWKVAIKLTPSLRDGWENEVKKPQKLRGITGVVTFHDFGPAYINYKNHSEMCLYTVWDYIHPGRNLKDYLKTVETCSTSFLVAVLEQILRVLHACEHRGVKRHGDLHLGNVLIGYKDEAELDSSLNAREPIYVSDFGYGATGGDKEPKDDYQGLAGIVASIIEKTEWDKATPTDRQIITRIRDLMNKLLKEESKSERIPPKEILKSVLDIDRQTRAAGGFQSATQSLGDSKYDTANSTLSMSVGQFQVSEMLGDDWERWKNLFVSSVPAKSRILEPNVHTVITGPRGCGKTMLLRRLSERLIVECGPIDETNKQPEFTALYVNSNDIADAFSSFQKKANRETDERLICYSNLAILSDLLAVQSARAAKFNEEPTRELLDNIRKWLVEDTSRPLVSGENELEYYRSVLEQIKWKFPKVEKGPFFPSYSDFSQHSWLPRLISIAKKLCPWINSQTVFIFIDDYTTPRISEYMQKVLNRLLFQRTSEFVCKIATESATTFIPTDSSNKFLQDGDDYQLIDIGEESLFMEESERARFLNEIFRRRLSFDTRIPEVGHTLEGLLGELKIGKLEFARLLRNTSDKEVNNSKESVPSKSQRRGKTRAKALYHGNEVFTNLWSGDTRTMIQLIQELVDEATPVDQQTVVPIEKETQDRVFRNRGGQWLLAQTRNQPTDRTSFKRELKALQQTDSTFELTEIGYGNHLKAVVEAFAKAARQLLLSPMYKRGNREVPRMAFRIEITDAFRIDGLVEEIYKDLIRYGMFMRDARGKSVRGAFVPRLYLRRLLLPYATLALSKRDSVQMSCEWFKKLLLTPDKFSQEFTRYIKENTSKNPAQSTFLFFSENDEFQYNTDPLYEDVETED